MWRTFDSSAGTTPPVTIYHRDAASRHYPTDTEGTDEGTLTVTVSEGTGP